MSQLFIETNSLIIKIEINNDNNDSEKNKTNIYLKSDIKFNNISSRSIVIKFKHTVITLV